MPVRLNEPDTNETLINTYNRGMYKVVQVPLLLDKTYALCLIRLGPAVQDSDYPALKSAIEGIPGIQNIDLIIDHHTRATVPSGTQLVAVNEFKLRLDPIVEAP